MSSWFPTWSPGTAPVKRAAPATIISLADNAAAAVFCHSPHARGPLARDAIARLTS